MNKFKDKFKDNDIPPVLLPPPQIQSRPASDVAQ